MRHHQTIARAAALLLALCGSSFAQAQWRCSSDTVRGTWGWQSHGTTMMTLPGSSVPVPVPFASLGVMKVDYQGRYTAHATVSVGGQVQDADLAGSIQVNADCTATETCTVGTLPCADRLVILDGGNEMRWMPTKYPLGPAAGVAYMRRLSWGEPHCTSDMVRGVYGGTGEGVYMFPAPGQSQLVPTPWSVLSTQTFQYGGSGTAVNTASMAGTIVDVEFPELSIEVNPDCTATMKYTGAVSKHFPGQTFKGAMKYIVLNDGDELIGMDTEFNAGLPIVLDNLKRISMAPMPEE